MNFFIIKVLSGAQLLFKLHLLFFSYSNTCSTSTDRDCDGEIIIDAVFSC